MSRASPESCPKPMQAKSYIMLWIDFRSRPGYAIRSAKHNLGTLDPAGGIARVDHQLGLVHNAAVIVIGMVGHDHDAVILAQVFQIHALHLQVIFATFTDERKIGIVIANLGSILLQEFDNG